MHRAPNIAQQRAIGAVPSSGSAELGGAGVMIDSDACLAMRPARNGCRLCSDVCPVTALSWSDDAPRVNDDCVGCGRCSSVCPTGALRVDGLALAPTAEVGPVLRVACRRVPESLAQGAERVACLGGIATGDVLEWLAADPQHEFELCDHGWCAKCPASGMAFAGDRVRAELEPVLSLLEAAPAQVPRVHSQPLDSRLALPLVEEKPQSSGRRHFFRALASGRPQHEAQAKAAVRPSAAARRVSPRLRSGRERWDRALQRLAARANVTLPAAVYPEVRVAEHCDLSGLCAAVCPGGALALRRDSEVGQVTLEYTAAFCVDCGLCQSACPNHALQWRPAGAADIALAPGAQILKTTALKSCVDCGQWFNDQTAGGQCPSCRIKRSLFNSLYPQSSPCANVVAADHCISDFHR